MLAFSSLLLEPPSADAKPGKRASAGDARKAELGQFMTPAPVAEFMARSFDPAGFSEVKLLDAGAGRGALSSAFAHRWMATAPAQATLAIHAYEIDAALAEQLRAHLSQLQTPTRTSSEVIEGDFIEKAVALISRGERPYTHAILNPPYKKINSNSPARKLLGEAGIETVNLYSGFVGLALKLVQDGGEIVAIIPRSFCNGPYYRSFRNLILDHSAIEAIHLFAARDKAFPDDNVLQENVIIRLRRGAPQGDVIVTTSVDSTFADLQTRSVPFDQIVRPEDPQRFIHIPIRQAGSALVSIDQYRHSLADIDVQVSTGPVVDFRVKRHLKPQAEPGDAPLLYPVHFSGGRFSWPRAGIRKPNAIAVNADTSRMLYPRGYYVVVRRFSSKEEDRRIIASLVDPSQLAGPWIAFENHLNVFHHNRKPLKEDIARGLVVYLNAKIVDERLRNFNGHTQVNATDLRSLPFPSREGLAALGVWSRTGSARSQSDIDAKVSQSR